MTRLFADARAVCATRTARRMLLLIAAGGMVVAVAVAAHLVAVHGKAGYLTAVGAASRVYASELLAWLSVVALVPLWWLTAMVTARRPPRTPTPARAGGAR